MAAAGLVDLEKELTCSICTDLLYQPLTLLDCLHTFCGACLHEWFAWQHTNASSPNPYTCPSCRASVRDTKHNAGVKTILDMFLEANPGRARSEREREELATIYKPGDNVLPKVNVADNGDDEDQRLLHEVQELSLREVGIAGNLLTEPSRDRHRRGHSRNHSRNPSRGHSRDPSRDSRRTGGRQRRQGDAAASTPQDPPRQVEHQSSLRSLLSMSSSTSNDIKEDIMRQIVEEGLLDGIDLNNITVEREDEISERIAQAYRRRQRERRQARDTTRIEPTTLVSPPPGEQQQQPEQQGGRVEAREREADAAREEPHLRRRRAETERSPAPGTQPDTQRGRMDDQPRGSDPPSDGRRTQHPRSSSQNNARTLAHALASSNSRPAARSAVDLSERQGGLDAHSRRAEERNPRGLSQNSRSTTDPDRPGLSEQWLHATARVTTSNPSSPRRAAFPVQDHPVVQSPPLARSIERSPGRRRTEPISSSSQTARVTPTANTQAPNEAAAVVAQDSQPLRTLVQSRTEPIPSRVDRSALYPEPHIMCNRCGKDHIEYDLHYHCTKCQGGNYDLCLRCYRLGEGCLHWYGFGYASWSRYRRTAPPEGYPPQHELPHILTGHRYRRPSDISRGSITNAAQLSTDEDPAKRLEAGVFCAMCHAFANQCFWKCDYCNEGEWGFCNNCVNQGRHCTHPLLPVAQSNNNVTSNTNTPAALTNTSMPLSNTNRRPGSPDTGVPSSPSPPGSPKSASVTRGAVVLIPLANKYFRTLSFTVECNICHQSIPTNNTRFHCQVCNDGDYDMCASCYDNLVGSGRITSANGPNGWRRCLRGHRMVEVGYEESHPNHGRHQQPPKRIIKRDLVGGLALKDEDGADSQAVDPEGNNANVNITPNWSWRETDGTVRRARSGTHQGSGSSSSNVQPALVFPPDGGVGLRVLAQWSYYPAEEVTDELMFPKGAEIKEGEDINKDWFWGVYAGSKGLFPGNFVRII